MREFEIIEDNEYQNGKITIWNDGKEKHNSWEARLCIKTCTNDGDLDLYLTVYSDTKDNVLVELNAAFVNLMNKFKQDWNLDVL